MNEDNLAKILVNIQITLMTITEIMVRNGLTTIDELNEMNEKNKERLDLRLEDTK